MKSPDVNSGDLVIGDRQRKHIAEDEGEADYEGILCRFLRWISKRNGGVKRCARRSFDEAVSSVPVNRQDHLCLIT